MAIVTEKENNHENAGTLAEFFANKSIFLTGGTGFLGTVLIEALLSTTPDVGTIYVLVRDKHGYNADMRINRILQKPIFKAHDKETLKKVVPVIGELSAPNLGLKEEVLNDLIEKVNIIYHSAATIRFSSPLPTAIKTNLTGTLRTLEFAKKLKKLSAYVYLSTAFCNSNHRGYISENVYKSEYDPYEMLKMAEDKSLDSLTPVKLKEMIRDHPNTYTFTKNLAENLIVEEMSGLPTGIVRPSIVYGTWEHPVPGWVGNANSGHLGFLAGFVKGAFRTMGGSNPTSPLDVIPCDYVINASLVMGWYVGTRQLPAPEIIHCTSGEVNLLTLERFTQILNQSVKNHPSDSYIWKPHTKLRSGWRYKLFYYIFQLIPALIVLIPEKLFSLGMTHHTLLEYTLVFNKGTKAFEFFLDKDFRYSMKNALRIMALVDEQDKKRYNFDASHCDWSEFMDRSLIGLRRYYFKESAKTTRYHRVYWNIFEVVHYVGIFILFAGLYGIFSSFLGFQYAIGLALIFWIFLMWL